MTARTRGKSLLPVSILAGPSVRVLLRDIVADDSERRFGLLKSASTGSDTGVDFQAGSDKLVVETVLVGNGGGYDPELIRQQIFTFAANALVDHLIVECDSQTHPIAFASLFLPGNTVQSLSAAARVNSIMLAIDSDGLLDSIVPGNQVRGVTSPCVLADQLECTDTVVLHGEPAEGRFMLARAVVSALNPRANLVERARETKPSKLLDTTMSFDFEMAFAGGGWRKLMEEQPGSYHGDQGVAAFVYRARRPFHPEKFWNLIQSPFPGVFRAKGFFWLATRMSIVGGINMAGSECHYSPAGQWWAASGNHSGHAEIPDRLKKEWVEPFGDRRQAIVFMGIDLDSVALSGRLDACLLNESEMESGEHAWAKLPDPFPAWSAKTHDHMCEGDDCCHH